MERKVFEEFPDLEEPEYPPLVYGIFIVLTFIFDIFYGWLWRRFMVGTIERVYDRSEGDEDRGENDSTEKNMVTKDSDVKGVEPSHPDVMDQRQDHEYTEEEGAKEGGHRQEGGTMKRLLRGSLLRTTSSMSSSAKKKKEQKGSTMPTQDDGDILGFPKDAGPRPGVKILSFERALHIRALNHPHIGKNETGGHRLFLALLMFFNG